VPYSSPGIATTTALSTFSPCRACYRDVLLKTAAGTSNHSRTTPTSSCSTSQRAEIRCPHRPPHTAAHAAQASELRSRINTVLHVATRYVERKSLSRVAVWLPRSISKPGIFGPKQLVLAPLLVVLPMALAVDCFLGRHDKFSKRCIDCLRDEKLLHDVGELHPARQSNFLRLACKSKAPTAKTRLEMVQIQSHTLKTASCELAPRWHYPNLHYVTQLLETASCVSHCKVHACSYYIAHEKGLNPTRTISATSFKKETACSILSGHCTVAMRWTSTPHSPAGHPRTPWPQLLSISLRNFPKEHNPTC
jgi:hypothetical protein